MIQSFIINSSGGFIDCSQNYAYLVLSLGGLLSCWIVVVGGFFVMVGLGDKFIHL